MHWTDLFTSGASLFIVATASTKTMVPLRILAIIANCFLITVFAVSHAWFPMAMQAFALPMNAFRLVQMLVLIRNVREAIRGRPSWGRGLPESGTLSPFPRRSAFRPLWRLPCCVAR